MGRVVAGLFDVGCGYCCDTPCVAVGALALFWYGNGMILSVMCGVVMLCDVVTLLDIVLVLLTMNVPTGDITVQSRRTTQWSGLGKGNPGH